MKVSGASTADDIKGRQLEAAEGKDNMAPTLAQHAEAKTHFPKLKVELWTMDHTTMDHRCCPEDQRRRLRG